MARKPANPLRPQPLTVLQYLAERPGQLVTKDELLSEIWTGRYVSQAVFKVCVRSIREALRDDASAPQHVETVGQEGYRFIADVSPQLSALSPSPGPLVHNTRLCLWSDVKNN